MERRIRIALIVYQVAWLNVVLPGHTRGAVTVPGYQPSIAKACCATDRSGARHDEDAESRERARHCAVCHFAAMLSVAPQLVIALPRLGLLETLPVPPPHACDSWELRLTPNSRAPPAAT